jgi:uncharacterized protein YcsI (UPF0317 family)
MLNIHSCLPVGKQGWCSPNYIHNHGHIQISSRYPKAHGAPIQIGDPSIIGIKDLCSPDRIILPGEITPVKADEVVLYWPCGGATMREIVQQAKLPILITDYPKSSFISDKRTEELAIF